jgi:hypothetical protein
VLGFFKGTRRKAGCVILTMSVLLTVLWGRSFIVWDWITVYPTLVTRVDIKAERGRLGCEWQACEQWDLSSTEWLSDTYEPEFGLFAYLDNRAIPEEFPSRWDLGGCTSGVYSPMSSRFPSRFVVIPYLWIIASLALLSFYLIIKKSPPASLRASRARSM